MSIDFFKKPIYYIALLFFIAPVVIAPVTVVSGQNIGINAGNTGTNTEKNTVIHAVTDLSHEFTFYADHRFYRQYMPDQKGVTSWISLPKADLSNANLLILPGCDPRIDYTEKDIHTIHRFLEKGGGVLILGNEHGSSQNTVSESFGAIFAGEASYPLSAGRNISIDEAVKTGTGITEPGSTGLKPATLSYLQLTKPKQWTVLVSDSQKRPVMAKTNVGKGTLVVASRNLAGSNPDASDSINLSLWKPLLLSMAAGKTIDTKAPFEGVGMTHVDHAESKGGITLRYNDYLKPYADRVFSLAAQCMPFIQFRMGVPLAEGMGTEFLLLPTDGGGFSGGNIIAVATWWDGFPSNPQSMIELITHESVHSWVLPLPEVWNEPVATYIGNLVMMDMGYTEEAEKRIKAQIERGLKIDPDMKKYDIEGHSNDLHWGKTFWILETLRKEKENFLENYFKVKRQMTSTGRITRMDMNNTVSLLSFAMGRDLFPWFREHGIDVERNKAQVRF